MTRWQPQSAPDLPDGLILFDGVCVLCAGWVKFVIPRDPDGRYRFVAIQTPAGAILAERFGVDRDYPQTNVVVRAGKAWFKGDSALRLWQDLPGWRWTGLAWLLPRGLRNLVYDLIARNRYRLFGRTQTCLVPTPQMRSRFLTRPEELT